MVKASLDTKDFEAKLKQLSKAVNKTAEESIIEMAQIGGRQLAHRMEPYGLDGKAKDIAQGAIYRDVNKAYDYIGQTFNSLKKVNKRKAYAFANAAHEGDLVAAEKIARSVIHDFQMQASDSGDHLEKVRGSDGRVSYGSKVMGISNDTAIDRIKEVKVASAGVAKAGWLQAVLSLGSKTRIPAWLRKGDKLGSSTVSRSAWGTIVTLFNRVDYVSNLLPSNKIQAALKNAYQNQIKKMERQLEKLTKKF